MTRVVVDSATQAKLFGVRQTSEVCDNSGRVLGHFIPVFDRSKNPGAEPQISEEELDRREREGGGRPLTALLADLEKQA